MLKAKNEQLKIQAQASQDEIENQLRVAEIAIDRQQANTDFLKVLNEMHSSRAQVEIAKDKAQAEETRASVDLAIKHADMKHSHVMDEKELQQKVSEARMNNSQGDSN